MICVAYVHGIEVAHSWHKSMMGLLVHHGQPDQAPITEWMSTKYSSGGLTEARNNTARHFLTTEAEYLLWVDTDMGFAPEALSQLLEVAHPTDLPVVGGLCFMQREVEADGMGGWRVEPRPVLFTWTVNDTFTGFDLITDYPRDAVVQVAGTGSAFILIHRSVFERIADRYGEHWYSQVQNPTTGQVLSEDLSFCTRLAACGIPLAVHTGVRISHLKQVWIDEAFADRVASLDS
jgi:hypothetical protein